MGNANYTLHAVKYVLFTRKNWLEVEGAEPKVPCTHFIAHNRAHAQVAGTHAHIINICSLCPPQGLKFSCCIYTHAIISPVAS